MNDLLLAYAVLGALVLLVSVAASPIKHLLWLSEPLLVMLAGIALGPIGLNWFNPDRWGDSATILGEIARLTLAISLMGTALRLPDEWIKNHAKSLSVILLAGMPLMWALSSSFAWLVLGLEPLHAALLGAVLTPTDPVVASSVVTGKLAEEKIAPNVRHLLSAESGANDGLGFLLLMLPVLLLKKDTGQAITEWLTLVLLGEVIGSILAGALIGYAVGKMIDWLYSLKTTHRGSLLAVAIALSLLLLGGVGFLHGDGILAVFAGGLAFNWVIRDSEGHEEAQLERIQETLTKFFDLPVFFLFGMIIPWAAWQNFAWTVPCFVVLLLLLRRIPVILLLSRFLKSLRNLPDVLFVGWFGPMAVAAMVYATWGKVREEDSQLWHITSLVIFSSIVVHGLTATPFTRLYVRARRRFES